MIEARCGVIAVEVDGRFCLQAVRGLGKQRETCGHKHKTYDEAEPCLNRLERKGNGREKTEASRRD